MRGGFTDLVVSARVFRRSPGLVVSVALTIGLGVGSSLAIFGLLHDALLGESPFRNASGIVAIRNTGRYYFNGRLADGLSSQFLSGPDFADLEGQARSLSAVGVAALFSGVMTGGDRPRPIWRTMVSPRFFEVLQPHPSLGRLLAQDDFKAGATPAALLTASMWRAHFGSAADVLGRTIRVDDQPFTVVGVVPDAVLRYLSQPEGLLDRVQERQVITPLLPSMVGAEAGLYKYLRAQRDAPFYPIAVGRLAPGQTPAAAASEVGLISKRLAAEHPATNARHAMALAPLESWRTEKVRGTTALLMAAALLVFLVASCNAGRPGAGRERAPRNRDRRPAGAWRRRRPTGSARVPALRPPRAPRGRARGPARVADAVLR